MCCLLVLLAFFTPRIVLFLMWLFSNNYLSRVFDTWLWPMLGFFFLPATTIGYVIAQTEFGGLNGLGIVAVLIGLAVDVGLLGGGARQRKSAG